MYKLVILAAALAVCSATVVLPSALHYVAAPHTVSKVSRIEYEHKPVHYYAAVAPVAPVVTYAQKTYVHHAAPIVHHAAPIVHHTSYHAPIVAAAPLLHHSSALLLNKKA